MLNIFLYMHKKTDCEVFWPIKGKAVIYKDKIQKNSNKKSLFCQVCCTGVLYNLDSSTRSFKLCLFPAAPCSPRSVWVHVSLYAVVFLSFFLLMPMAFSQLMVLKEYWTTEPDKHKKPVLLSRPFSVSTYLKMTVACLLLCTQHYVRM